MVDWKKRAEAIHAGLQEGLANPRPNPELDATIRAAIGDDVPDVSVLEKALAGTAIPETENPYPYGRRDGRSALRPKLMTVQTKKSCCFESCPHEAVWSLTFTNPLAIPIQKGPWLVCNTHLLSFDGEISRREIRFDDLHESGDEKA